MFNHLNLSFNVNDNKVDLGTAATDIKGQPFYQYTYSPTIANVNVTVININLAEKDGKS